MRTATLRDFATARSGDKGNHANLGVVAKDAAAFAILHTQLTADRVAAYFGGEGSALTKVTRYELPKLLAFNFVLENILDGGASRSLRIDTQGKLLGTAALDLPLEIPD